MPAVPPEIESPEGELKGNSGPLNDLLVAENPPIDTKVLYVIEIKWLAERGGFEPPVELMTLRRFSKPLLSTTQPPLREGVWTREW